MCVPEREYAWTNDETKFSWHCRNLTWYIAIFHPVLIDFAFTYLVDGLQYSRNPYVWVIKSKQTILAVACSASLPLPVLWKPWEVLVCLREIQTFHTRYPTKKKSFWDCCSLSDLFFCPFPQLLVKEAELLLHLSSLIFSIAPSDPHYWGFLNVMLVIWFSLLRTVVWISYYWLSYKPNSSK